jgi:hypothetical protein
VKVTRLAILVALPALFVAALVFERDPAPPTAPSGSVLERSAPVAAPVGAPSSTWYCAAGTATGPGGEAEQILVIANDGEEALEATLTAHADDGEQTTETVTLDGRSRTQVRVSELIEAAWASVVVEAPGGGIAVDHVVTGPTGRSVGPCASSVSPTWYLPAGTTALGVSHRLVLFNPFAADAVLDVAFETETDRRTPEEYQGLVVPAGHVSVLAVSDVVTVRDQVATEVVARSGLVVAEQLEIVTDESELPTSTALALGAPGPAPAWHLPAGPALGGDVTGRVVVFNPGDEAAEVDVQVALEDPAAHPVVEPFELTVRAGQFAEVDLAADGRVPQGVAWSAVAVTRNDVAVVAGTVVQVAGDAAGGDDGGDGDGGGDGQPPDRGRTVSVGSPVVAAEWRVPYGGEADGEPPELALVNPSSTEERRVRLEAVGEGSVEAVPEPAEVVVPAGGRAAVRPEGLEAPGTVSLRVVADGPVSVARTQVFAGDGGLATAPAVAVGGTLELATAPEPVDATDPSVALEGIIPDDTGPPPDDTSGAGSGDGSSDAGDPAADEAPAEEAPPDEAPVGEGGAGAAGAGDAEGSAADGPGASDPSGPATGPEAGP